MSKQEFESLKNSIVDKFMSEYQGERIGPATAEGSVAQVNVAVENMHL